VGDEWVVMAQLFELDSDRFLQPGDPTGIAVERGAAQGQVDAVPMGMKTVICSGLNTIRAGCEKAEWRLASGG